MQIIPQMSVPFSKAGSRSPTRSHTSWRNFRPTDGRTDGRTEGRTERRKDVVTNPYYTATALMPIPFSIVSPRQGRGAPPAPIAPLKQRPDQRTDGRTDNSITLHPLSNVPFSVVSPRRGRGVPPAPILLLGRSRPVFRHLPFFIMIVYDIKV